jgi:hypothetical protein
MDGFVHGKLADRATGLPEQDATAIDPGNPWRCLRSIKWTKAMDGFVHGKLEHAAGGVEAFSFRHFKVLGCLPLEADGAAGEAPVMVHHRQRVIE